MYPVAPSSRGTRNVHNSFEVALMLRNTPFAFLALALLIGCDSGETTGPPEGSKSEGGPGAPSTPSIPPAGAVTGPATRPKGYPAPLIPTDEKKDASEPADAKKADEAKPDAPKADEPKKDAAPQASAGGKTEFEKVSLTKDEIDEIKKELTDPADQKVALEQKVCPVGWTPGEEGGHLGEMGAPIKKVVGGKTVFLCCKGCVKEFEADPAKYLAKFKK